MDLTEFEIMSSQFTPVNFLLRQGENGVWGECTGYHEVAFCSGRAALTTAPNRLFRILLAVGASPLRRFGSAEVETSGRYRVPLGKHPSKLTCVVDWQRS